MTARFQAVGRQCAQAPEDGRPAAADGDEADPPLVDPGQLGVGDHLAVEVEPLRVVPGDLVPELDEPHQLAGLVGAGQVGVGVAQARGSRAPGRRRSARSGRPCRARGR